MIMATMKTPSKTKRTHLSEPVACSIKARASSKVYKRTLSERDCRCSRRTLATKTNIIFRKTLTRVLRIILVKNKMCMCQVMQKLGILPLEYEKISPQPLVLSGIRVLASEENLVLALVKQGSHLWAEDSIFRDRLQLLLERVPVESLQFRKK